MGGTGTTYGYGYTGEQQDDTTGLLYLRARYYNPALRSFMGQDPWSGNSGRPQSMNGWSYVENSPSNLTDPTGNIPERCKQGMWDKMSYVRCVAEDHEVDYDYIKLMRYRYGGSSGDELFDNVAISGRQIDCIFVGQVLQSIQGTLLVSCRCSQAPG